MRGDMIVLKWDQDPSSTITEGKVEDVAIETSNFLELGMKQGEKYNDVYFFHKLCVEISGG